MKTPSTPLRSHKSGMTLLELSVVILVLLSLITILFVGASAWKKGADRSSAIIVIRSAQLGMRAHSRSSQIETGPLPGLAATVFGSNSFVQNGSGVPGELPIHPAAGKGHSFGFVETDGDIVPPLGTLYICTDGSSGLSNLEYNPQPSIYRGW